MQTNISLQRQRLWRIWRTAERLVRRMRKAQPMCPGSLYLLRRRCGKPNCRCREGALHATWVVTRSEQGRVRLYRVPAKDLARVRRLTGAYRDWQRARAALVKIAAEILQQLDALAEGRLQPWPPPVEKVVHNGPADHRASS